MFVVLQIISECLSHDGSERTADELQRVLELNAMVYDLLFLASMVGMTFTDPSSFPIDTMSFIMNVKS